MSYRKRALGGYNGGKKYKEESNRKERQYGKREAREQTPAILGQEMGFTYGGSCGTLFSLPTRREKKSGGYWDDSDFISVFRKFKEE